MISDHQPESRAAVSGGRAPMLALLRNRSFRRFFIAQSFSSLGDWIGMVAIVALVGRVTQDEFAVAAILLARLLPALFFGPVAGVLVDRWNRKRLMVACDLGRAALIGMLPFVDFIGGSRVSPLVVLFAVSAVLEVLTLMWQPSKDASIPRMIPEKELMNANSLILFAAYGTFPLAGVAFGGLAAASKWLGTQFESLRGFGINQEHLAFVFDAVTFTVSAAITATLVIPKGTRKKHRLDFKRIWTEFSDGIRFIREHPLIRPLVLGIGALFSGIGIFLALSVLFVQSVLGAGSAGFGLLITAVGIGLGLGFALGGWVARYLPKQAMFLAMAFAMGIGLILFASVSTLPVGLLLGGALGLFAGVAYPSGLTLVQENVRDELRGRTLASLYSVVRLSLVGSLAVAPALAKIIGNHRIEVFGRSLHLTGSRAVLWAGGLVIFASALMTRRSIRSGVVPRAGLFFVLEGGEGAGKSTQIERLARHLRAAGHRVVVTKEPGGTPAGGRIRDLLLDSGGPPIGSRTEALLYAADRAQHVDEVIRPALSGGAVVVSDRYLDSSLAYQGIARGLGVDEVLRLNRWATADLMPDLVFFLDHDPEAGLARLEGRDRIESEGAGFHSRVQEAYRTLARRYPARFIVVDASGTPDEVESEIRGHIRPFLERLSPGGEGRAEASAPGPAGAQQANR